MGKWRPHFLEGKSLVLIIQDFVEKATLGKGLILSAGMSWEANIHVGEAEFSPVSQVFSVAKEKTNPHTQLNVFSKSYKEVLFLKHFA